MCGYAAGGGDDEEVWGGMRAGSIARRGAMLAAAVVAGTLLAACGDDDDTSSGSDSTALSEASADNGTDDTTAPTDTGGVDGTSPTPSTPEPGSVGTGAQSGENAELCALATEMFTQESPPTAEQLTDYQELAPDEVSDAVETAAAPLIEAGEDVVAFFNAYGQDDVEAAVNEINMWETENC